MLYLFLFLNNLFAVTHKDTISRIYDTATVVTINGRIEAVNMSVTDTWGPSLLLVNDSQTVLVRTAPLPYLYEINAEFNQGDSITVKGSMVTFMNREQLIAQQITKGENIYIFRKPDGTTLW
jgi:hypothetical protein